MKFKIDIDPNVEQVDPHAENCPRARGYFCEIYKSHFILPDAGPIGANSLALP